MSAEFAKWFNKTSSLVGRCFGSDNAPQYKIVEVRGDRIVFIELSIHFMHTYKFRTEPGTLTLLNPDSSTFLHFTLFPEGVHA